MSGDVQPRKRKDKKRKKDELGVEEPRGTAAVLGEGDVFLHSHHDHGTGGHWCAKIIFFSLLAVLVTLIGLIILENRGLTELEANSVESRYSGVLDGWIEDTPNDDHHDEHTLELLKHHDDQDHDISQEDQDETTNLDDNTSAHDNDEDEDDQEEPNDQEASNEEKDEDDDDEHYDDVDERGDDDDEQDDDGDDEDEHDDDDDEHDDGDDEEEHIENNENELDDDKSEEQRLQESDEDNDENEPLYDSDISGDENDDNDIKNVDEIDSEEEEDSNFQNNQVDEESTEKHAENSQEDEDDDEEHEENEEEETDSAIEVEKLEQEVSDEGTESDEQPTQEIDADDKSQEISSDPEDQTDEVENLEEEEFLEDDIDEPLPIVERIVAPKGKPLPEVEDEPTTAKPADTLADEEEYEKQQEELRKEQAEASHVWLKLAVGGALLVATHAVVSRAVAPRDATPASEDHAVREDTPSLIDRRMTLILEGPPANASPNEVVEEIAMPVIDLQKSSLNKTITRLTKEESEEDVEEEEEEIIVKKDITKNKEMFSDDEDEDELEEEEEVKVEQEKEASKQPSPVSEKVFEPEPEGAEIEEDVPDDVEIIDDDHLEEELEEEENEEEEISDVDDAELLTRLEAKYGRLPEPERPQKHKDGGNSIEEDWPGDPTDKYWRQQLDQAEEELRQGAWSAALGRAAGERLRGSGRARWLAARALDAQAEEQRDNRLLSRAIAAYLDVLKLNERLTDARLLQIATRTLDRIRFRGNYLSAEPVYRLLIRRFPDVVDYRNNLTVSLLMANRADIAEETIKETLKTWPDDRVALAHLGFILKTQHNRHEEAVEAFQKALKGDVGPATESRFYYHLGDSLLLLNRFTEAQEVHKRGAKLGHFLSPAQRSLYNVNRLKSRPWWDIEQTPYLKLARALEKSWKDILKEGQAAQALYEKEKEGLKERGEWSQLDLFVRGQEVPGRCKKAPVTCSIVRAEKAAGGCRRGQIKFSAMEAGTHVRPHVGPTNCRLRMHLGLSNTKDTYIRVDQEIRQWHIGKVFMFDDSFEHEVWHNGTGTRLVLIVDVWHPALTANERRELPPI